MAIASSGAINVVQALSRSLDKVFDEAQLTGVLLLNGRNLKDFPNVASRYDLTDTVEVDLSKNRFNEFPVQISEFVSLETLYLYHNCIRSIPIAVQYLESLTHLDLSRNQLQCIPAVLCTLPLEVLLLGNNRLTSLPKEICRLSDTLMELDISCNKLESLPIEMSDLKKLRVLNARENLLSELPYELCKLKLQVLDVSSNRISQLNVDLRHMTSLVQFDLNHNPLIFPPAKLCNSGRVHVFKALEVAFVKQTKRQGISHEQDFQRKCNTLKSNAVRLIPTDPEDFKYVLNPKTERRKNRHHTVAADSGYSTLTDDTSRSLRDISDVHLRKRSPPVGEEAPSASPRHRYETDLRVNSSNLMSYSMYSNCPTKDLAASVSASSTMTNGVLVGGGGRTGSFVEEVMSACMERMSFAGENNKSPLQQNSSPINVQHHQLFLPNNGASTNKDDEVTRELWRQREEYLNRKKRAGLLRMEVLQDAGESMLSPSVSNGVDLNCNNCNGAYQKVSHVSYMSQSWIVGEKRSVAVNGAPSTPASSVINEESSSVSSYNLSELTPSPCEPPTDCPIPVQQMISSTNDSAAFPFSSAPIRTPPSNASSFTSSKEKAFSPPRSVRSEVIQSIYNGTAACSPNRYATTATNGGTTCEARPLTEQPLAVYSMDGAIEQTQPVAVSLSSTKLRDEQSKEIETQPNFVENCTVDAAPVKLMNGEHDNKTRKRVNVVDLVPKKTKETASVSNGRGSLSSSQSSVSSSSSSSRAKSAGNKLAGVSSVNGTGNVNGGNVSNPRKSSLNTANSPISVKLAPPPVPVKSAAASTTAASASAAMNAASVSNRLAPVFHRGNESLQNGTSSSHVVNSNSLARKVSDSVERQQQIVDEMRKALEEKLNIALPHDHAQLSETLSDGVYLCNYLNILRPKTVRSVHTPTEAVPKVTLAKRNVENFLTGCRRLAIPETNLFAIGDVVDKKNLVNVGRSVNFINKQILIHSKPKSPTHPLPVGDHGGTNSSTTHAPLQHRISSQRMTKV